jgi:hypothetical protein
MPFSTVGRIACILDAIIALLHLDLGRVAHSDDGGVMKSREMWPNNHGRFNDWCTLATQVSSVVQVGSFGDKRDFQPGKTLELFIPRGAYAWEAAPKRT